MPLDAPSRVARDHLAVAGERDRLDRKRGLLAHLAHDRLDQRLAGFHHAARQRVDAERRLARAPHHQHLAVADDGGADREDTDAPDRFGRRVIGQFHQPVDHRLRRRRLAR